MNTLRGEPDSVEEPPSHPAKSRTKAWAVVALATILALSSWRFGLWQSTPQDERGSVASSNGDFETGLTVYPPGTRPEVPVLRGITLDGEELDLESLRGHIVVVNVWGSWCVPCRAEAPDLAKASRQTYDAGVRFVGIDTRDTDDAARAFTRTFKIPYPSIIDKNGELLLPFSGVIPLSAVPSTLVIDPEGGIAATVVGKIDYTTLIGLISDLLAESGSDPIEAGSSP